MTMARGRRYGMVAEDWKKEYEKVLLSRKYSRASSMIGICSSEPVIENIKRAYGFIVDFVTSIPIPVAKGKRKKSNPRKEFLGRLDEIGFILFGSKRSARRKKLMSKYGVTDIKTRRGVKMVSSLSNLPNLIKELREILIDAGEYATTIGLRITLAATKKYGLPRLLEEEGMEGYW